MNGNPHRQRGGGRRWFDYATRRLACLLLNVAAVTLLAPAAHSQAPGADSQAPAAASDDDCLACHGQKDLKSDSGRSVFVDPGRHKDSVHAVLSCTSCHTDIQGFPHPQRIRRAQCVECHPREVQEVPLSVHGALGAGSCEGCHGPAHDTRPAAAALPQVCASCHAGEVKDFLLSAHGAALKAGDSQTPTCLTCHGAAHRLLASSDPASPAAKKNLPETCGSCHADAGFLARHEIPFAHPVETYKASVHGRAVAQGDSSAASCADCHSAHAIYPARDPRSTVSHQNVPSTCGACHTQIAGTYRASVHGQAVGRGVADAPVCTDCHGDHAILAPSDAESPVNPSRVSLETCGHCHGDERLDARYNLPADRVPTFADSFHGLAARAGSQTVANCASCHGVHNIFPSSDPRSTINPANLSRTCGTCHEKAGQVFPIGPVHVGLATSESPAVRWIRRIYWVLIPGVIGFMFIHQLLDFLKKLRDARRSAAAEPVVRMNRNFRIAHMLTVISFPILVLTGFALKFPEAWWARPMLVWESRFAFRGTVHRAAAVVLLLSLAYHAMHLALVRQDRAFWREMLPRAQDLRDLVNMLRHNLGRPVARPTFGRFSYLEKLEYLAFLWGTLVMAATGFILWFNGVALRYLPKWVSDAATALHFYEAILAASAILIWHMYTVVFDPEVYPMDTSWLTGKASEEHFQRARPACYAEVFSESSGQAPPDAEQGAERRE